MARQRLLLREYWRDTEADVIWAVELDGGAVVACAGPLTIGEAMLNGDLLDTLEYTQAKAGWLQEHVDRFVSWEPSHDVIWPT